MAHTFASQVTLNTNPAGSNPVGKPESPIIDGTLALGLKPRIISPNVKGLSSPIDITLHACYQRDIRTYTSEKNQTQQA